MSNCSCRGTKRKGREGMREGMRGMRKGDGERRRRKEGQILLKHPSCRPPRQNGLAAAPGSVQAFRKRRRHSNKSCNSRCFCVMTLGAE